MEWVSPAGSTALSGRWLSAGRCWPVWHPTSTWWESDDAPGVLVIGLVLGLVATAVLGLMLVLRELLRRATVLRTEMDEVI